MARITSVFDNRGQAEQAVNALRNMGVSDNHISVVAQHDGKVSSTDATGEHAGDVASGASKGLLAGAGVGALFGLGAALIPGIGPFITAGALATALGSTVAGAAASGAIVGSTIGTISGALARSGYDEHEANHYGGELERGSILVAVDNDSAYSDDQLRGTLSQYGGRMYGATGGMTGGAGYGSTMGDTGYVGTGAAGHNIVTGTEAQTDAGKSGLGTGALVGGALGAAVGGPVGAVVGGTVGSLVGGVTGDAAEAADRGEVGTGYTGGTVGNSSSAGFTSGTTVGTGTSTGHTTGTTTETYTTTGTPVSGSTVVTGGSLTGTPMTTTPATTSTTTTTTEFTGTGAAAPGSPSYVGTTGTTTGADYDATVGGHNVVTGGEAQTDAGKSGLGTGAIVGGVIGTALGGPVGAVVGGTVGSLVGGVAGDAAEATDTGDVNTTGTHGSGTIGDDTNMGTTGGGRVL